MKKLVTFLIVIAMLLGACNSQPTTSPEPTEVVVTKPTDIPMATIEPTPVPTETPTELPVEEVVGEPLQEEEEIEWSCENDPARNAIIDLGEFGRYRAMCNDFAYSELRLEILFTWWHRVSPSFGFKLPESKKGDVLTFKMPEEAETRIQADAQILYDEVDEKKDWGEDGEDTDYINKNVLQLLINGEEWSYQFESCEEVRNSYQCYVTSKNGETIIPRGAEVKIIALMDFKRNNIIDSIFSIVFEKNEPVQEIESVPRELVVDEWFYENDPAYGMIIDTREGTSFKVGYNYDWNRFYLEYTEELQEQVQDAGYFSFVMPEDLSGWIELFLYDPYNPYNHCSRGVKVYVDGEEWVEDPSLQLSYHHSYINDFAIATSRDGQFLILPGSVVEVYYPNEKDERFLYEMRVLLERNYKTRDDWVAEGQVGPFYRCSDEVQYGHPEISNDTVVDLGSHGAVQALCDPKTNRWFVSFQEEEGFVKKGPRRNSVRSHIDDVRGVLEFKMPTKGVIIYDSSRISPTGIFTEESETRYVLAEKWWVVLYINSDPAIKEDPSTGVYVIFFN